MNKAVKLLIAYDEFEQKYPELDLADFCRYFLTREKLKSEESKPNYRGTLLRILGRIASAFNVYHRAAMKKTDLPSYEGFYFLNGLAFLGELKKTDLINFLMMEYTTGMESINKLLKGGFINERQDNNDLRAKLISLSEKGKKTLNECYIYTTQAGEVIFGELDEEGAMTCIALLDNIEKKHSKLAVEYKNKDFDAIYRELYKPEVN